MKLPVTKLPDAEFDVMQAVWNSETPVATKHLLTYLNTELGKNWSIGTLQTLLNRLTKRGFLSSVRNGKERFYIPEIPSEAYLQFETQLFLEKNYGNSPLKLIAALLDQQKVSAEELDVLESILERGRENDT